MNVIIQTIIESWHILSDAAPFMLFGLFVAGLLKAFLPDDLVARHLGGGNVAGVMKASALGVPIPLCSCSVLPAAAGLREQGAGKGPTASFLISTPETGVDSIAITYALLDPVMTVIRPVAAFVTAMITGIAVNITGRKSNNIKPPAGATCSRNGCGCAEERTDARPVTAASGWWPRLKSGLGYAFGDLLGDIGGWFLGGILAAGLITVFVSPDVITRYMGGGLGSMLIMLTVAAPIYVCATASTPIAAALALKGVSPGAALVFLLAGPATNVAALAVISKILGRGTTAVYLMSIVICSLGLGLGVNKLYAGLGLDITGWVEAVHVGAASPMATGGAVVLLGLIGIAWLKQRFVNH
ncbi:MAG: SO_0444 family Cu/Zn efflux transporter [Thermodesulfobacteriota bacterium]|nr:SO_0444 family Cu/Zn efflux transporter [Thermodesulfobacteriota bacterium]